MKHQAKVRFNNHSQKWEVYIEAPDEPENCAQDAICECRNYDDAKLIAMRLEA